MEEYHKKVSLSHEDRMKASLKKYKEHDKELEKKYEEEMMGHEHKEDLK